MAIKIGDRVRIKERKDWPTPPGYRLADAEGVTVKWVEWEESMKEFPEYVFVKIDKAKAKAKEYIGSSLFFRIENLEKI